MKTVVHTKTKLAVLFFLAILFAGVNSYAQQTKKAIFKQADLAMQNAKAMKADLLSPNEYSKALNYYQDALKDFDKEKGIEKVEASLTQAVTYFNRSVDFSISAKIVFANTLDARDDALSAGANSYAKEQFTEAEEQFVKAAEQLEKGDRDDSYKESVKAVEIYRKAELLAIKADLLDETRKLLENADKMDVGDNAPRTLKKAKMLLAEAEKDLETNRYDMDFPRTLAKQAKYEALHAIYLNATIKNIEDKKIQMEDVILDAEIPLIDIASTIGFVARFDQGTDQSEKKIIYHITDLQERNDRLYVDNADQYYIIKQITANIEVLKNERNALNVEFKTEIGKRSAEMKAKMQQFENEKAQLADKINYQTKINEKFDAVNIIFDSTEAMVFRSGNDVIIRMDGFGFEVGKSEIKPANFDLLTKVQTAINIFPNSKIVVKGYTDSFGSDSLNLILSQQRSDAVTKYLTANMAKLDTKNISSVGYGENNPVANNETEKGRLKNRRIDLVITPAF